MKADIPEVVDNFQFDGKFLEANPYGFGHINDTYSVWFRKNGAGYRYLLQRINHNVFKQPAELMQNIERVTRHLRHKIVTAGGNPDRETLTLIPTHAGESYYVTSTGNYWRAYIFIEDALAHQVVKHPAHIYHAAKAFGKFQQLLSDFPADQLFETIPNFHHTARRYAAFIKAVDSDVKNRAGTVKPEIEFVTRYTDEVRVLVTLFEQGQLPRRVTHNDTKFNNVMLDDVTQEGICVIDLDTVMPGLSLYDFGDSVRTGAATAAEDEQNLSQVGLGMDIFDRLTCGYLEVTREILTPNEIEQLPFSAKLMTLESGIRFLTDYLNGDIYFKTHRAHHNLDRARTQFKMVQDMETKFDTMTDIVRKYC